MEPDALRKHVEEDHRPENPRLTRQLEHESLSEWHAVDHAHGRYRHTHPFGRSEMQNAR